MEVARANEALAMNFRGDHFRFSVHFVKTILERDQMAEILN